MVRPKVLIVGWDGVRDDTLRAAQLPAITALADTGRWWSTRQPDVDVAPTVTAVGWSTMLSGVWPDRHRVLGNECELHLLHRYPDLLSRASAAVPDLRTYAATSALIFGTDYGPGPILGPGIGHFTWFDRRTYANSFSDTDPLVGADAERTLREEGPDLSFVYLGEADKIAHRHGVGDAYGGVLRRLDAWLGRFVAAVRGRPTFADEDWLILVTTDHGHLDAGGHGGGTWQERQTFLVAGSPAPSAARTWRERAENVDIAPTAWDHLGVRPSSRWPCEGTSLIVPGS